MIFVYQLQMCWPGYRRGVPADKWQQSFETGRQ